MFGLFGSKKKKARTFSRIGMKRDAAFSSLVKELKQENNRPLVFYFFEESRESLKRLLEEENVSNVQFVNAKKFSAVSLSLSSENKVYCIDHYPLLSVFKNFTDAVVESNPDIDIIIYGGLDEPVFNQFGGDRIRELMVKLGMKENEIIDHSLVTRSLENAQEKIENKVLTESVTQSAAEWFKLNLPSSL